MYCSPSVFYPSRQAKEKIFGAEIHQLLGSIVHLDFLDRYTGFRILVESLNHKRAA